MGLWASSGSQVMVDLSKLPQDPAVFVNTQTPGSQSTPPPPATTGVTKQYSRLDSTSATIGYVIQCASRDVT